MNLPVIRKTSVVMLSVIIVATTVLFGEDMLNMVITPLPQSLKSCISKNFSNEVNAQATCTSIANGNSVAVWESVSGSPTGKIRESNLFEDYALGRVTHKGDQGLRMENSANKFAFITSENSLHIYQNAYWNSTTGWKAISSIAGNGTGKAAGFQTNVGGGEAFRVSADNTTHAADAAVSLNPLMVVQLGGKVGINTTAPLGKLDIVAGGARTGTHATSPGFYVTSTMGAGTGGPAAGDIEFKHDNGTQGIGFGYNSIYQTGSSAGALNLLSYNGGNLTLNAYPAYSGVGNNVGNVGIKTASPAFDLDVNGYTRVVKRIYANEYIQFDNAVSGLYSPINASLFEPNPGTFGPWRISGSKGAWNGIEFTGTGSNMALMMGSSSYLEPNTYSGVYSTQPGYQRWLWRSYGTQLQADSFAAMSNTGYVLIPNGTSTLNTVRTSTQYVAPYGFIYGDGRLHIQAQGGEILYLNPYATGGQVLVGSSGGNTAGLYVYGTVGQSSDARFKKDIRPIENALDKVLALKGEYFTYKKTDKKSIGFIAQDVKPILPEVVQTDKDGYLGLDYANLTAVLNEAIKEFHAQFTAFKKDISEKVAALTQKQDAQAALIEKQQKQIDELQKKVEALEKK